MLSSEDSRAVAATPRAPDVARTTEQVVAYAVSHFELLRGTADDHLRTAQARRGEVAMQKARVIGQLHDQLMGALCLIGLLAQLGDKDGADKVEAAWSQTGLYLVEAGVAARMAAVPGWNAATRSFDRAPQGATL